MQNNDIIKQIDEMNVKVVEMEMILKEKEFALSWKLHFDRYLDNYIKEKRLERVKINIYII